jgi:hypothetical protein
MEPGPNNPQTFYEVIAKRIIDAAKNGEFPLL